MSFLELLGFKPKSDLDNPIVEFPGFGNWTRRDAYEGVGLIGIPHAGKTTAMALFINGGLANGAGFVALAAKPSAAEEFPMLVQAAGRESDLHILDGKNGERYNPFSELSTAADAAALLNELAALTSGFSQEATSESFWPIERNRLLRHLCELSLTAYQRTDAQLLTNLLRGLPLTTAEFHDPLWREKSPVWSILERNRDNRDNNFRQACDYVEFDFSRQEKRMQGSIIAMARSVLDPLLRDPLASIFSGKSTVTVRDVRECGKIISVGLPSMGSADGKIANAIIQYCFCQRTKAVKSGKDCFFISDECQETLTKELMSSLAVLREYRVCVVIATQSLGTLNLRTGKEAGEALLSLCGTLVFLKQTHKETREWATGRISTYKGERRSMNKGNGDRSFSYQEDWLDRVPERYFQRLGVGESICVRGDKFWRCTWPKNGISGWGKVSLPHDLRKRLKR